MTFCRAQAADQIPRRSSKLLGDVRSTSYRVFFLGTSRTLVGERVSKMLPKNRMHSMKTKKHKTNGGKNTHTYTHNALCTEALLERQLKGAFLKVAVCCARARVAMSLLHVLA